MEPLFYMHFAAFLIYFGFAVFIISTRISSRQRMRLFIFSVAMTINTVERIVCHNHCTSFETVDLIHKLTMFTWVSVVPVCLLIAIGISKLEKLADSKFLNLALFLYVASMAAIDCMGLMYVIERAPFGWFIHNGGRFGFVADNIDMTLQFVSLFFVLYALIKPKDKLSRMQAVLILAAGVVVVATNFIWPAAADKSFLADSADVIDLMLVAALVAAMYMYGMEAVTLQFISTSIFRDSSEIMMLLGLDGSIVECNDALSKISGRTKAELLKMNFSFLVQKGTEETSGIINAVRAEGKLISRELELFNDKKGLLTASIMKIGNTDAGIACVISDITMLKNMQHTLSENYEKLVQLDTMKTNLTHSLTHDLRTPMVSIKGFVSLMKVGAAGAVNEAQRDMLDTISRNIERQLKLINDMLDVAKMQSGGLKIEKTDIDIVGVFNGALKDISGASLKKNVTIEITAPQNGLTVQADEFRLWQVAENLLGNSIKFSPEGSKIKIEIAETDLGAMNIPSYAGVSKLRSKNFVIVSVTDSGEGVSADDLPKIFDKFYQAKSAAGQSKGTGLGLSIVKNIIEAHDGAAWAESDGVGKGTVVKFVLPVENPKVANT